MSARAVVELRRVDAAAVPAVTPRNRLRSMAEDAAGSWGMRRPFRIHHRTPEHKEMSFARPGIFRGSIARVPVPVSASTAPALVAASTAPARTITGMAPVLVIGGRGRAFWR
ncbi:hypothetical protein GCM10009736_04140 [Actinomadura bangladeshensis]